MTERDKIERAEPHRRLFIMCQNRIKKTGFPFISFEDTNACDESINTARVDVFSLEDIKVAQIGPNNDTPPKYLPKAIP